MCPQGILSNANLASFTSTKAKADCDQRPQRYKSLDIIHAPDWELPWVQPLATSSMKHLVTKASMLINAPDWELNMLQLIHQMTMGSSYKHSKGSNPLIGRWHLNWWRRLVLTKYAPNPNITQYNPHTNSNQMISMYCIPYDLGGLPEVSQNTLIDSHKIESFLPEVPQSSLKGALFLKMGSLTEVSQHTLIDYHLFLIYYLGGLPEGSQNYLTDSYKIESVLPGVPQSSQKGTLFFKMGRLPEVSQHTLKDCHQLLIYPFSVYFLKQHINCSTTTNKHLKTAKTQKLKQ